MKKFPAIAMIELSSIARGTLTGDAVAKKAPLDLLRTGTVQPGRYLVLFGGEVAPVEESYHEGLRTADDAALDSVILPDILPQVLDAILGKRHATAQDSLGVVETSTSAAIIHAADAGAKGAEVTVMEVRLADGMGGKGIVLFTGRVADVEAALAAATDAAAKHRCDVYRTIIPALDAEMSRDLGASTSFFGK